MLLNITKISKKIKSKRLCKKVLDKQHFGLRPIRGPTNTADFSVGDRRFVHHLCTTRPQHNQRHHPSPPPPPTPRPSSERLKSLSGYEEVDKLSQRRIIICDSGQLGRQSFRDVRTEWPLLLLCVRVPGSPERWLSGCRAMIGVLQVLKDGVLMLQCDSPDNFCRLPVRGARWPLLVQIDYPVKGMAGYSRTD